MSFEPGAIVRCLYRFPIEAALFHSGSVLTPERRKRPRVIGISVAGGKRPGFDFYQERCVVIEDPLPDHSNPNTCYVQFNCGSIKEFSNRWLEQIPALELLALEG